jgi:hypothetical protein
MSHLKVVTDKPLEVINLKERGTLVISPQLAAQITALHAKCGERNEWSGMLVYRVIADDRVKPSNFRAVAEGVFPMDFGNSGYTEYDYDATFIDMLDHYPKADPASNKNPWKIGQIHSHHGMGAFFSGTDTDELKENAGKYTYYLSLIVNLAGTYCAKVAFVAKTHKKVEYRNKKGKIVNINYEPNTVLVTFDLDIKFMVEEWFDQKLTELSKSKTHHNSHYQSYSQGQYHGQRPANQNQPQVGFDYTKNDSKKEEGEKSSPASQNSSVAKTYTAKAGISGHRDKVRDVLPYLLVEHYKDAEKIGMFMIFDKLKTLFVGVEGIQRFRAGIAGRIEKWLDMFFEKELKSSHGYIEEKIIAEAMDLLKVHEYSTDSGKFAAIAKGALEVYLEKQCGIPAHHVGSEKQREETDAEETAKSFAEAMASRGSKAHEDAMTKYYEDLNANGYD